MNKFNFATTGIGSLSLKDPASAVELVISKVDIPFWPQLPQRGIKEGMIMQFSEKIPCLRQSEKTLIFSEDDQEKELEKFYEKVIQNDTNYFALSSDYASGFKELIDQIANCDNKKITHLKGQVVGPFTFASSVKKEGASLVCDDVMMEAISKALCMKALWQAGQFKSLKKHPVIFIDEPFLGCFGSAYTPVNKDQVVKVLGEFIGSLKEKEPCLVGIHCCGNTDWGMLLGLGIDIINFDAFGYTDNFLLYHGQINDFLRKGGIIAWGLLPTSAPFKNDYTKEPLDKLYEAFKQLFKKGIDKDNLLAQSMISPSCGLASLDEATNNKILSSLSAAKNNIRKHFLAAGS